LKPLRTIEVWRLIAEEEIQECTSSDLILMLEFSQKRMLCVRKVRLVNPSDGIPPQDGKGLTTLHRFPIVIRIVAEGCATYLRIKLQAVGLTVDATIKMVVGERCVVGKEEYVREFQWYIVISPEGGQSMTYHVQK
jgi:hypothetical protein